MLFGIILFNVLDKLDKAACEGHSQLWEGEDPYFFLTLCIHLCVNQTMSKRYVLPVSPRVRILLPVSTVKTWLRLLTFNLVCWHGASRVTFLLVLLTCVHYGRWGSQLTAHTDCWLVRVCFCCHSKISVVQSNLSYLYPKQTIPRGYRFLVPILHSLLRLLLFCFQKRDFFPFLSFILSPLGATIHKMNTYISTSRPHTLVGWDLIH